MRALVIVLCAAAGLAACQDSYSSNAERDTHMGDVRAAAPPAVASETASAAPPAASAVPPAASPAPPSSAH